MKNCRRFDDDDTVLLGEIEEAYDSGLTTVAEIVDCLRSSDLRYALNKRKPITKFVRQNLPRVIAAKSKATTTNRDHSFTSNGDESSYPDRKRLKRTENTKSYPVSSDGENGSIYSEYDLTKSMLRSSYSELEKWRKSKCLEESNKEIEVIDQKPDLKLTKQNANIDNVNEKVKDGPRFYDLGGMKELVEEVMYIVTLFYHPELRQCLGIDDPVSGILLHGPPGCGKTMLAEAIANETGYPFYEISATELVPSVLGVSEENIRDLFSKAYRTAPSVVFIDEIDMIGGKRESLQRETDRRIVGELMACMEKSAKNRVLVIGATNRPDALDPALRRPERFDCEFYLGHPDENARMKILSVLTSKLKVEGEFDLLKIARATPGFVGADLSLLVKEVGKLAVQSIIDQRNLDYFSKETNKEWKRPYSHEELKKCCITMANFEEATKRIQPSSRRAGFSSIPDVKWDDIGGLNSLREEFEFDIVNRIKDPEIYDNLGIDSGSGFLLYGPPGCGKTLVAQAVANKSGANFIHIKGPELLDKYVGESELAVRTIFARARTCSPCILFFDEVDVLTGNEGGAVVNSILKQLLVELDGGEKQSDVYVIGATNRPHVMDPAIIRSKRFGKRVYVSLPSPEDRGLILKALAKNRPIDASVDLIAIGRHESCKNFSGADLYALMQEAAKEALKEKRASKIHDTSDYTPTIKASHFETALVKISPTVPEEQIQFYEHLKKKFGGYLT